MSEVTLEDSSFRLDAGRLALDFMATLGNRDSSSPIERLPDPASLAAWCAGAGLTPRPPAVTPGELSEARALREALFEVVRAAMHRQKVSSARAEELNRTARASVAPPQLIVYEGRLDRQIPSLGPLEALAVVARDAIDLLTGPELELLRECEADDCTGIYVDTSRGHRRRWCSTARCGNRARVAAHRARRRAWPALSGPGG
jgi:predicted RNA-binding Zn ribbon-like protein